MRIDVCTYMSMCIYVAPGVYLFEGCLRFNALPL